MHPLAAQGWLSLCESQVASRPACSPLAKTQPGAPFGYFPVMESTSLAPQGERNLSLEIDFLWTAGKGPSSLFLYHEGLRLSGGDQGGSGRSATSIGAAFRRLFRLRKAGMLSRHWRLCLPFPLDSFGSPFLCECAKPATRNSFLVAGQTAEKGTLFHMTAKSWLSALCAAKPSAADGLPFPLKKASFLAAMPAPLAPAESIPCR